MLSSFQAQIPFNADFSTLVPKSDYQGNGLLYTQNYSHSDAFWGCSAGDMSSGMVSNNSSGSTTMLTTQTATSPLDTETPD